MKFSLKTLGLVEHGAYSWAILATNGSATAIHRAVKLPHGLWLGR